MYKNLDTTVTFIQAEAWIPKKNWFGTWTSVQAVGKFEYYCGI